MNNDITPYPQLLDNSTITAITADQQPLENSAITAAPQPLKNSAITAITAAPQPLKNSAITAQLLQNTVITPITAAPQTTNQKVLSSTKIAPVQELATFKDKVEVEEEYSKVKNILFANDSDKMVPEQVDIKEGGIVVWTNISNMSIMVQAIDGSFKSPWIDNGSSYYMRFDTKGDYYYNSRGMRGIIGTGLIKVH